MGTREGDMDFPGSPVVKNPPARCVDRFNSGPERSTGCSNQFMLHNNWRQSSRACEQQHKCQWLRAYGSQQRSQLQGEAHILQWRGIPPPFTATIEKPSWIEDPAWPINTYSIYKENVVAERVALKHIQFICNIYIASGNLLYGGANRVSMTT